MMILAEVAKKGFEEIMKLANELPTKGGLYNKCKAPRVLCGDKGGNKFVRLANEAFKPQMPWKLMDEILMKLRFVGQNIKVILNLRFSI